MKLTVTGRHVTVTAASRRQIETKTRRVERLLGRSAVSAQCVLWRERGTHVCELTVHARGDHMLHGIARDALLPAAVTAAVEKVAVQALRLKDRWTTRRRSARPTSGNDLGGRP